MLLATWLVAPVLLVGALTAAGPASAANPACAQAGPCVIVQEVQGDQVVGSTTFYADEITGNADVTDASYPVSGGGAPITVNRGSSVSRLVSLAVRDPVTFVEVVGTDRYGRHLLTSQELGGGGFPGGLEPVFYATDPTVFNYVRPQRNAGDQNGAAGPDLGAFFSDPQGSLVVRAHTTGGILAVGVTASATDAGQRTFALGSDPTGAGYSFDWHLPDLSTTAQVTPAFAFPANSLSGSYPVTVGIERASDGSFGWGSTMLQVGPKPSQQPSPSPTPSGTGGDGPGDTGPTHNPSGSASADPNPDPTGGTGSAQPTDLPTLPSVPTDLPSTSGPTAEANQPSPSPTESSWAPEQTQSGDQVSGIALTSVGGQPVTGGDVVSDAPRPSQAARPLGDGPLRVGTGVACAAGALLLLLAGAGSESVRLRRWLLSRWSKMAP